MASSINAVPLAPAVNIASSIARVTDELDPVLACIKRVQDGTLGEVQADDLIMGHLAEMKLSYKMTIHCRQLALDPENRNKTLGSTQEVPMLIEDILSLGWSSRAVAHALCAEVIPGDTTIEKFNRDWVNGSAIPLAPVV